MISFSQFQHNLFEAKAAEIKASLRSSGATTSVQKVGDFVVIRSADVELPEKVLKIAAEVIHGNAKKTDTNMVNKDSIKAKSAQWDEILARLS